MVKCEALESNSDLKLPPCTSSVIPDKGCHFSKTSFPNFSTGITALPVPGTIMSLQFVERVYARVWYQLMLCACYQYQGRKGIQGRNSNSESTAEVDRFSKETVDPVMAQPFCGVPCDYEKKE